MKSTDNTPKKQGGRPFKPGVSGNPNGRPKGSRNVATRAMEALLDGESEELTRKAIELAKGGDITALRLCLDRILPPRKDRPVQFPMPSINSVADAPRAMAAVADAVAIGELTITEGADASRLIEGYVRAVEATDLEKRLRAIEEAMKK